mgnify:FL=1
MGKFSATFCAACETRWEEMNRFGQILWGIVRAGARVGVILAAVLGLLALMFYVEYRRRASEFDLELVAKIPERSVVYD